MKSISRHPLPEYEAYAIRYATRDGRRVDHFVGGDSHDAPMPMDYYTWVIRSSDHVFAVDTGFAVPVARRRGRTFLRCPVDTLRLIDIEPSEVRDVVITHGHHDHVGNVSKFPMAQFHLQEREMAYATGRHMRSHRFSDPFEVDDVAELIRMNFQGRLVFHASAAQLADGLTVHLAGGHTDGLQFVRVWTRRGWLVLASDVAHFYENLDTKRPFPIVFDIQAALAAFEAVLQLAQSRNHIIPGHDPLIMKRYPPPRAELEGIVARLD